MYINRLERVKGAIKLLLLTALLLLTGCASIPSNTGVVSDPWEPYNRTVDDFNEGFDQHIGIPVAEGYQVVTPDVVDHGVSNFFANLLDVNSAVNNLLQLKVDRSLSDIARVMINSTVGLLGFFDVASDLNLQSYKEDFGQTLGYWGVGSGPYFVLPFLGPSSVRDTIGLVADVMINPLTLVNLTMTESAAVTSVYYIDQRADLLEAVDLIKEAAIDPYAFMRDSYLQKRRSLVYDGDPPMSDEDELMMDDDFDDFEDELGDALDEE
ncbi:MAG: VacJ family lipoprotein [Candidatus Polarisedimenticolaceae bacterium]|nr:VacJ family lipoprotein [Candidatus Polarisedimenticolaceae bacterium]